jgi:hypothetical protein
MTFHFFVSRIVQVFVLPRPLIDADEWRIGRGPLSALAASNVAVRTARSSGLLPDFLMFDPPSSSFL